MPNIAPRRVAYLPVRQKLVFTAYEFWESVEDRAVNVRMNVFIAEYLVKNEARVGAGHVTQL